MRRSGSGYLYPASRLSPLSRCRLRQRRKHDDTTAVSSSVSEPAAQFAAPTEAPADAQEGGDLTVIAASDVDYIDPGAAYYQYSFMVDAATQSPLEAYAPPDVEEPTPALAEEAPTVSDDGKTITYKIRSGVKFSPPVDREATAADVKYAIERALLPGVPNGFVQTYLAGVEGIDAAVKQAQDRPDRWGSRYQRHHGA